MYPAIDLRLNLKVSFPQPIATLPSALVRLLVEEIGAEFNNYIMRDRQGCESLIRSHSIKHYINLTEHY